MGGKVDRHDVLRGVEWQAGQFGKERVCSGC
jgi:hypothetical protein